MRGGHLADMRGALLIQVRSLRLPDGSKSASSFTESMDVGTISRHDHLAPATLDLRDALYSEYAVRIDDMLRRFAISVNAMTQSKKFRALPSEER